jgi:hypothetical protein
MSKKFARFIGMHVLYLPLVCRKHKLSQSGETELKRNPHQKAIGIQLLQSPFNL